MSRIRRAAPGPPPAPDGAAPGRSRAWSNAFIVAFLLFQVLVPLRYYAAGSGSDERFAWRFFSTVGSRRCEVRVDELVELGGVVRMRAVDLPSELPSVWIGMLRGERPQVVAKFLQRRCEPHGVREVVYRRTCVEPDGSTLPPREIAWDCARGGPSADGGGA